MKRITIWALLVAAAFGWTGTASAVKPASTDSPFINVTTTPDRLDLGTAPFMGPHEVKAALTVEVDANCVHGPIYLSTTPLSRRNGGSIEPERVFVRTEATNGFVAIKRPVAISQTAKGSHKIVLDVRVDTPDGAPAGEYSGVFSLMIVPPV
ncbi:MAG: hypothetical protein JSW66_12920 [Phycisphaerales bacterium]|nr:MAG: hypothetical protein JSW66_12920 [Phycisphaerales bacterium]